MTAEEWALLGRDIEKRIIEARAKGDDALATQLERKLIDVRSAAATVTVTPRAYDLEDPRWCIQYSRSHQGVSGPGRGGFRW